MRRAVTSNHYEARDQHAGLGHRRGHRGDGGGRRLRRRHFDVQRTVSRDDVVAQAIAVGVPGASASGASASVVSVGVVPGA
jgi:hypothetical protein